MENTVIPISNSSEEQLNGVPTIVAKSGTQLFLQGESKDRAVGCFPTWFTGVGMACAYCLRKGGTSEPVYVSLKRDVRLVHLMKRESVDYVVNELQKRLDACESEKGGVKEDNPYKRFALRRIIYEQKRINKLVTAVKFSTGLGASKQDQEDILSNVFSIEQKVRDGFDTEEATKMNVQLDDTLFGNEVDKFNRISISKYDYVLAEAVKEVFPWSDGYVSSGVPSTWHVNQLYPSEVCLFHPGTCVDQPAGVPEFAEIKNQIDAKTITPLPLIDCDAYSTRIYISATKPVTQEQTGGADKVVKISPTVELVFPNMPMDNPLINNEVSVDAANHDAWNICPPPPKKNR